MKNFVLLTLALLSFDDAEAFETNKYLSRMGRMGMMGMPPLNEGEADGVPHVNGYDAPTANGVSVPEPEPVKSRLNADKDIDDIFRKNQIWKTWKLTQNPAFFDTLGSQHKPKYMWIGK
jgi:hypothetical protein